MLQWSLIKRKMASVPLEGLLRFEIVAHAARIPAPWAGNTAWKHWEKTLHRAIETWQLSQDIFRGKKMGKKTLKDESDIERSVSSSLWWRTCVGERNCHLHISLYCQIQRSNPEENGPSSFSFCLSPPLWWWFNKRLGLTRAWKTDRASLWGNEAE